ncbi:hypothetical protein KAZ92_03010 [Candidatus Gracilibacteria bacterium]|nr:hypothetical protein [Candidatus Gracilibacteria bacterium]
MKEHLSTTNNSLPEKKDSVSIGTQLKQSPPIPKKKLDALAEQYTAQAAPQKNSVYYDIVSVSPLPDIITNWNTLPEKEWKQELLAWHLKLPANDIAEKIPLLTATPVTPEYKTFTLPNQYKAYEKEGLGLLVHRLSLRGLLEIARTGAAVSLIKRMEKTKDAGGRSTESDLARGGANGVFLSMQTTGPGKIHFKDPFSYLGERSEAIIIYKHKVLDRIDWYAYNSDEFGRTDKAFMDSRPNPLEFFKQQSKTNSQINEIIFPHAIRNDDIETIVLRDAEEVLIILETLEKEGITHINGEPLKDIIVSEASFKYSQTPIGKWQKQTKALLRRVFSARKEKQHIQ